MKETFSKFMEKSCSISRSFDNFSLKKFTKWNKNEGFLWFLESILTVGKLNKWKHVHKLEDVTY